MKKIRVLAILLCLSSCLASCGKKSHHVSVLNLTPDYGSVTGEGDYKDYSSVTIRGIPKKQYVVESIQDEDGDTLTSKESYKFNMPSKDMFFMVKFTRKSYTLTLKTNFLYYGISESESESKHQWGEILHYEVTDDSYIRFSHWEENGSIISTAKIFDYEMPQYNVELSAVYVKR